MIFLSRPSPHHLGDSMRLWSLHPCYLDRAGLGGCWREALLAQNVLMGQTKGYRNHSQLTRFRASAHPLHAIGAYLKGIWWEATFRHYTFDKSKIIKLNTEKIPVTTGQVEFEIRHLQKKLLSRNFAKCVLLSRHKRLKMVDLHPLFVLVDGPKAEWEKGS